MANPLTDKEFLRQLDEYPLREIYAKIIALTQEEYPIDEIQGRATAGSINLDGDSAVRRSCSLTLIADDIEIRDYYWGLKNKFKLEVGMRNFIGAGYPEIIWFPQGVYLITSFNTSQNITGYTVSISGKDKMALLNGEISGKIHAISTRLDIVEDLVYDKIDKTKVVDSTETKIPIKEIITQLVHEYGNEPMHNIIINDVDDYGLELLEYRGSTNKDLMVYRDYDTNEPVQIMLEKWVEGSVVFDPLVSNGLANYAVPEKFNYNGRSLKVAQIQYGQTAGYRLTELTYPGELVVSAGETITGVLDKIKTMLNDFEYFYDINGRFVFQRKPIYINQSWNTLRNDGYEDEYGRHDNYSESMMSVSPVSYQFQNNKLLISVNNAPNFSNLKNDFSIWGKRKSISGAELPIHLRYAIQKKPKIYRKISDNNGGYNNGVRAYDIFFSTDTTIQEREEFIKNIPKQFLMSSSGTGTTDTWVSSSCQVWVVDWRELIYQMALDYRRLHYKDDYLTLLHKYNPHLLTEKTQFEQYYVDMEAFWRQLYTLRYDANIHPVSIGVVMKSEPEMGEWAKEIESNPETLNFWFDFLDTEGDMGKYAVNIIGDRAQVVNDDKIQGIWFKDTPQIIYYDASEEDTINRSKSGYSYFSLAGINELFSISSQGKSAKDELDNQLQNYSLCTESVSITALPIYYLQPNTRIRIKNDDNNNVNGEYILSKITLPLTHNGTMSITAVKDSQTLL